MAFANQKAELYNDTVVRQFAVMTVVWGVVGMLVGVIIAAQLAWPELNLGIPWLTYGRLRPLHTNAVIFAFGGCALMATSFRCMACSGAVGPHRTAAISTRSANWSTRSRPTPIRGA